MANVTPIARNAVDKMMVELSKGKQQLIPGKVTNIEHRTAQTIEDKVQQSNAFLSQVNNIAVTEIKGDILALDTPAYITKRTTTAGADGSKRRASDPTALLQRNYECKEIEQDSVITWDKIDAWAHLPDFYNRFRAAVLFAQGRDRLQVMWNGQTSAPDTSDPELRDVNEGFFAYMMRVLPENVLGLNPDKSVNKIKVDASDPDADFKTLDEIVYHLRHELLHKLFRHRTDLRVLVGDDLLVHANASLLGASSIGQATERVATNLLLNSQAFGATDLVKSDQFPSRGLFLSSPKNLSRYWQSSSYRRKVSDDDHRYKGVVDYLFVRECFVAEAAEGCACVHPDSLQLKINGEWTDASDVWAIVT